MPDNTPVPAFIERQDRTRTDALATIDTVLQRAADDDRELTEVEENTLKDARARLERADSARAEWTEMLEAKARGDELGTRVQGALARSGATPSGRVEVVGPREAPEAELKRMFRDAGDYVNAYVYHASGQRVDERLQRAVANQLVADNLGVVPTPIIGPVVDLIYRARPVVASVNNRPLPAGGRSFTRPKVSQHTLAGAQATEKTELASQKMTIDPITVNKATYGGTLDISFQDRDWTDPAILQIVIDDMAYAYAVATDTAFCTAFVASVSATSAITAPLDGTKLIKAISSAAGTIMAATGRMPDSLWVAPNQWAALASLVDTTGRALFSTIGPMNASGAVTPTSWNGNVYGLQLIVDQHLADGTAIVGVSDLAEYYETIGGQLSVTEPSILGFLVAYYGYAAFCFPAPSGFCKLTGVVTQDVAVVTESSGNGGK